ncbi:MAG: hypothetical protein ABIH28_00255 [archaeon]
MPSVRLRGEGKGDYVRRVVNGKPEEVCLIHYSADFSIQGCMAQVDSEFLEGVIRNNGKYDDIHAVRKAGKIDERCGYCYARRKNWGRTIPLQVTEMTRRDFETIKPQVVRIGRNTESLHPFYMSVFVDFLNLCKEDGVRIIAPTKALSFGKQGVKNFYLEKSLSDLLPEAKDISKKLKSVNAVVNYSIGNDLLEPGIVSQGFTNLWRIQQALLYREAGVNSTLTLTCDVTTSFRENAEKGVRIFQVLNAREKGIPIRILPLRIPSKKIAKAATGEAYSELIRGHDMFDSRRVRYLKKRNNELVPAFFHQDFQELVENGVGICGQIGEKEYCDKCQVFDSGTRISFPIQELVRVKHSPKFYQARKKRRDGIKRKSKLPQPVQSTQLNIFR